MCNNLRAAQKTKHEMKQEMDEYHTYFPKDKSNDSSLIIYNKFHSCLLYRERDMIRNARSVNQFVGPTKVYSFRGLFLSRMLKRQTPVEHVAGLHIDTMPNTR